MESFAKAVKQTIPDVYDNVKNKKDKFGRKEFMLSITRLLGYTPSDWETETIYKNKYDISLKEFERIVLNKIQYLHIEKYLHDFFTKIDTDCKGYVTLFDYQNLFDTLESPESLNWCKFKESFRALAENGIMDFRMFLSSFYNSDVKMNHRNLFLNKI